MNAKAAVLHDIKNVEIEEVDIGDCGEFDVIVNLKKATLCPTDIKKYNGDKPDVKPALLELGPYVLGHEAAGIVTEVGQKVKGFSVGEHVVIQPMVSCGECAYCKQGKGNMCLNILGVGASAGAFADCIRLFKEEGIGGCFSNYIKVPESCLIKLPEELPLDAASLVEPLADVVNSVDTANVRGDDHVVIFGLGPMGLFHVVVAKYYGAKSIVCIDIDPTRLEIAQKLGADVCLNTSDVDVVAEVKQMNEGLGATKIFVTAGGKAQRACVEQALQMCAKQGTVCLFASAAFTHDDLTISINYIHYRMIKLIGVVGFGQEHGEKAIEILNSNFFDYKLIRNIELPLSQFDEAVLLYGKGANLKVGLDLER